MSEKALYDIHKTVDGEIFYIRRRSPDQHIGAVDDADTDQHDFYRAEQYRQDEVDEKDRDQWRAELDAIHRQDDVDACRQANEGIKNGKFDGCYLTPDELIWR